MKKFIVSIAVTLMLLLAGCQGDESKVYHIQLMKAMSEQTIAAIETYDARIDEAEAALVEYRGILNDPNLGIPYREQIGEFIDTALETKGKFEAYKDVAYEKAKAIHAKITELEADGIQPGEDLIAFGETLKQTGAALPPPVGPILGLIGGIFAAIGEARRRKANKTTRGVVESVNSLLGRSSPEDVDGMKAALKEKQRDLGVRKSVRKLLDT